MAAGDGGSGGAGGQLDGGSGVLGCYPNDGANGGGGGGGAGRIRLNGNTSLGSDSVVSPSVGTGGLDVGPINYRSLPN